MKETESLVEETGRAGLISNTPRAASSHCVRALTVNIPSLVLVMYVMLSTSMPGTL